MFLFQLFFGVNPPARGGCNRLFMCLWFKAVSVAICLFMCLWFQAVSVAISFVLE